MNVRSTSTGPRPLAPNSASGGAGKQPVRKSRPPEQAAPTPDDSAPMQDDSALTFVAPASLEALQPRAAEAEAFLKAMANRHRLMILCELHKGERCVTQLQQAVGLAQSALSQHLAKLREEAIVKTRRQSQTIFYSLADRNAARLIALLYEAYCRESCETAPDAAV